MPTDEADQPELSTEDTTSGDPADEREAAAVAIKSRTEADDLDGDATDSVRPAKGTKDSGGKGPKDPKPKARRRERSSRGGNFIVRFIREVLAELRKVLWPTRRELGVYTAVVIVFVVIMISIVAGLDFGFARLVLWVFG